MVVNIQRLKSICLDENIGSVSPYRIEYDADGRPIEVFTGMLEDGTYVYIDVFRDSFIGVSPISAKYEGEYLSDYYNDAEDLFI